MEAFVALIAQFETLCLWGLKVNERYNFKDDVDSANLVFQCVHDRGCNQTIFNGF